MQKLKLYLNEILLYCMIAFNKHNSKVKGVINIQQNKKKMKIFKDLKVVRNTGFERSKNT